MGNTLRARARVASLIACVFFAGCTPGSIAHGRSGFLGDYSELKRNADYPAALVYLKTGVPWSEYNAIQLDSVSLWGNDEMKRLDAGDRQRLTDALYSALSRELGKHFALIGRPGPNTVRLRAAVAVVHDAHAAALATVTTAGPHVRAVGDLSAEVASAMGAATVEVELADSLGNERLAAVVDERTGGDILAAKPGFATWDDVNAACDSWARKVAWRTVRFGVQRKPGVPTLL